MAGPQGASTARFVVISPDGFGGAAVAALFATAGYPARHHLNGRLADGIAHGLAAGRPPLDRWPEARLFAGLYHLDSFAREPLEIWRDIEALDHALRGAVFILLTRDPVAWSMARLAASDGSRAQTFAHWLRVPISDLPRLWQQGWRDHLRRVSRHFGDDPRLIRINTDAEPPAALIDKLRPWIDLTAARPPAGWRKAVDPMAALAALDRLPADAAPAILRHQPRDDGFVADVAGFCLRGIAPGDGDLRAVSPHYGHWDGGDRVTGRNGKPRPVAIGRSLIDGQPRAYPEPGHLKIERLAGVINDVIALGRRDPVHVDMEDSRWMGSPQGDPLGRPVLVHNRRQGAVNPVLWPLPGYHDLGSPGFARPDCPDPIPFRDKADRLVWRGNLSGSVRRCDRVKPGRASHAVLADLAKAGDDPARRDAVWQELRQVSRLRFVRRFIGHPDFDLGIALSWGLLDFARDPLIAPFLRPRVDRAYFHGFRYQLCLTGYDHGSNFLGAINSQSVLLAEDDGWEVFYSGRFQPWKHFIPVARYCDDVEDKLAWARANNDACIAMSAAARAEVAKLSDKPMRDAILNLILDGLAQGG